MIIEVLIMIDTVKMGGRIRQLRKSSLLTCEEFADMISMSVNYVRKLEKGQVFPSIDIIDRISQVFRCDILWLLYGLNA